MVEPYLDLNDRTAVCDFIESVLPYVPEKDRKPYEALIQAGREEDETVTQERLAEAAKNVGAITWPHRRALARFVESVGSELEWEAVVKTVRPSTATVLRKLRKDANATTLDGALADDDASILLKPDQEIEISMVRDEVRIDLYEDHKEALEPMIDDAAKELEAMKKRLKRLRERAVESTNTLQEASFDKLFELEDRIYFGGEAVPLEVLDADVQFEGGATVTEDVE
ncbi:hypothetical protein EDM68_04195 [Candidatus Uhrbacteria bacterium]|nr:MAG: hypothetical protein EDM68_04195 [Candidatus Uhrbacteria bacterium]